ncbi:MAG: PQQ-binding-like beta-propeller repeat protein [Pseudomonadota bacterium]
MMSLIAYRAVYGFLGLVSIYLTLLGAYLAYLGGSFYYIVAGLLSGACVVALYKRHQNALQLLGALLAITLLWSVYESGLHFLALLPRLAFWMVIALWFFTPLYRTSLSDSAATKHYWLLTPLLASAAILLIAAAQGHEQNGSGTVRENTNLATATDWRHYGNDAGGSRFAAIAQINVKNVGSLEEAWRYRTGVEDDFKMTPLQVGERLYLCGARNVLMALDSESGEEVWRYDPKATAPAEHQYALTCRGVSYFEAPAEFEGQQCQTRIVTGTVDARLIAVDASTGKPCANFGDGGQVDLRKGLGEHLPNQYYVTSPPLVVNNLLVVGGLVLDSQDLGLPSGVVRAFDAISGEFVWAWDVGRPGNTTEPADGEEYTRGTPNVWTVMSYDADLDLIYAPTGNASPDYWGGVRRKIDDEWSSALVALEGKTGTPRWKFQTVHHDIWDYDLPAQPVLVDVEHEGQLVPSVAVATKRGDVFLLDRRDGKPVYPIDERPVPQSPELGDYLSATQPFSPLPNFHPQLRERDMWGLTPVDQLLCRVEFKRTRYEGLFTPPTAQGSLQFPANFGGFNWGSVSVDADNGLLVAAPMRLANRVLLVTPQQVAEAGPRAKLLLGGEHPAVRYDADSPMPEHYEPDGEDPYDHRHIRYYGLTLPFMSLLGTHVPCFEPPWSEIAVMDLNTKELLWRRPLGSMNESGPFGWRSGLPFEVGVAVRAGTVTTRGGLTFISSTMDRTVRAYDLRTGDIKWSADLPGNGQATPMTYVSQQSGRQYLIVTVPNPSWRYPRDPATGTYKDSGSNIDGKGGYVIAYALPDNTKS